MFPRQSVLVHVCHPAAALQDRVLLHAAALNQHYSLICGRRLGGYYVWPSANRSVGVGVPRHCGMSLLTMIQRQRNADPVQCSTALSSYQTTRFITRVKGGLIGLVYQETMKARTVDLGETTAIALMGTDIERIGHNFLQLHEIWASIIEIGVAIWLLERQVFLACLAPVAVILSKHIILECSTEYRLTKIFSFHWHHCADV